MLDLPFVAKLVKLAYWGEKRKAEREAEFQVFRQEVVVEEPKAVERAVNFKRENRVWVDLTPEEVFKATRSYVLPDNILFTREENVPTALNIDGTNNEICRQMGRALAHNAHCKWVVFKDEWDLKPLPPHVYVLEREGDAKRIRVMVYMHSFGPEDLRPVALTERWNYTTDHWERHPITDTSRKAAERRDTTTLIVYSKYHLLAMLLLERDMALHVNFADFCRRAVFDGYRRELWQLAGYAYQQFNLASAMYS